MSASVLFDTPGPKAKQRILAINVVGVLLIAGLLYLVVSGLAAKGQMEAPCGRRCSPPTRG